MGRKSVSSVSRCVTLNVILKMHKFIVLFVGSEASGARFVDNADAAGTF